MHRVLVILQREELPQRLKARLRLDVGDRLLLDGAELLSGKLQGSAGERLAGKDILKPYRRAGARPERLGDSFPEALARCVLHCRWESYGPEPAVLGPEPAHEDIEVNAADPGLGEICAPVIVYLPDEISLGELPGEAAAALTALLLRRRALVPAALIEELRRVVLLVDVRHVDIIS